MELAAQLESRSADLELFWVPRDVNKEADRLAEGDYASFDTSLRVGGDATSLPFLVLPALMSAGLTWHGEAAARASAAPGAARPSRGAGPRPPWPRGQAFKEREPW